jgi:hypothetical protein
MSVYFGPQEIYTGSATASGRRILVQTSAERGVSRDQRGGSSVPDPSATQEIW